MLYNLFAHHSSDWWFGFNLFKYLTFRTGAAFVTSIFFCLIYGGRFISFMKKKQKKGQPIRDDGPISHIVGKQGTPTMGGVLILASLVFSSLLWTNLQNIYIWLVLFVTLGCGGLGFWDDYTKVRTQNSKGISSLTKLSLQFLIALMAMTFLYFSKTVAGSPVLYFPFFKNLILDMGVFFIPFGVFVIVGSSNAVNLTDGLDGLAIGPVIIAGMTFALFSYVCGNSIFAHYLHIPHVPGAGELSVFCGALVGAGLGFLWFNAPPAMVIMGDTGSLALGGAIGMISVIIKKEILLAVVGGLFVVEALSVIIQVSYFKWSGGKRIFLMAPLHHHFEKKGWSEPSIVIRFWILSILLAVISLASLKIR
jgi:phospho-N-acetylmuramoyl-pentapeptide-transferase